MGSGRSALKVAAKRALRLAPIRWTAFRMAAARGRGLVLVYHRVTAEATRSSGIIPSVPEELFRGQVEALMELGEVVPIETFLQAPPVGGRSRFAVTFDDDYLSHHDLVLPLLQELEVTATFFLCGRSLHGLGPAWFGVLDRLVQLRGLQETSRLLGIVARTVEDLAVACERSFALQEAVVEHAGHTAAATRLSEQHIAALTKAGMTIGFHTLRHPLLTLLDAGSLEREVAERREALEDIASQRISLFAYPHGKGDARTAQGVRGAGYRAAVTGQPSPTRRRSDPYLIGRWEPGDLKIHDLRHRPGCQTVQA